MRQMENKSTLRSLALQKSSYDTGFSTLSNFPAVLMKKQERARPRFVYIEPESSDEETTGTFTANPAEDIPRNKLTEKLARGL